MSYARFASAEAAEYGWEESDIYVFLDCGGYFNCCACRAFDGRSQHFRSTAGMIAHLRAHETAGDKVPFYTIPSLEAEAVENDAWIRSVEGAEDAQ